MNMLMKLFGGHAPVRVMRLFILNPESAFESSTVARKANISSRATRTELSRLCEARLIKRISFFTETSKQTGIGKKGKVKTKKKRVSGFVLDNSFPYLYALRMLLVGSDVSDKKRVVARLQSAGKIKLIVLAGEFLRDENGRIDLLIVGDGLSAKRIERALHSIESDIGKELRYAAMDTKEFHYRIGMYDKFMRDIFDYPHEKIVDKIGL